MCCRRVVLGVDASANRRTCTKRAAIRADNLRLVSHHEHAIPSHRKDGFLYIPYSIM